MKSNLKNRLPQSSRRRAFTLIELLLVLVILGTLAAIVLPRFAGTGERAKKAAAATQISTFKTVLGTFEVDNGFYPKVLTDLVKQPSEALSWHGPYLDGDVPPDPWGNAYNYENPGKNNPRGYDLMSMGPDGQANTDDDITNWSTKR